MTEATKISDPYFEAGLSGHRPQDPPENTVYYSTDLGKTERFINKEWVDISPEKESE